MGVYLLDTCIWGYWFGDKREQHVAVKKRVEALPTDCRLGISIITWGEIAYGHKVESANELPIQAEYIRFVKSKGPKTFEIDIHTANKYGELRSQLFDKYAPKDKRKKNMRPEQLVDPITSLELGMQENDLWIAAQAMVRNLTLVTNDKLTRIREVAGDELHIEKWVA